MGSGKETKGKKEFVPRGGLVPTAITGNAEASTHECASFRQCEAGLHGLRGRQLICTLSSLSFKARRLKLCMQPRLMNALVLGNVRPASTASEAVS